MNPTKLVVAPDADNEGFSLLQCDHCKRYFFLDLLDLDQYKKFCCPYCSLTGNHINFIHSITDKFSDFPLPIKEEVEFVTPEWIKEQERIVIEFEIPSEEMREKVSDMLVRYNEDIKDPKKFKVIELKLEDILKDPKLSKFDMFCCEKYIKVPIENIDDVNRCPFCFSEIIR